MNFEKYGDALIPAIVQDTRTGDVLMLGFMTGEALELTRDTGRVTFFSRSRKRLWTKGETSGNFLEVDEIIPDCDDDTLLIRATPSGPVCHSGSATCFGARLFDEFIFLRKLEDVIDSRQSNPTGSTYVGSLFALGIERIAQKVGEEAVETVIAALGDDEDKLTEEAADLLFHLMVLLRSKDLSLKDVIDLLSKRHI